VVWVSLLAACAPGQITTPFGAQQLTTAIYYAPEGSSMAGILLANSPIPCELSDSEDPSERLFEQMMIEAAFTREDSFTLWMELNRPAGDSLLGSYAAVPPEASNGETLEFEARTVSSFFRMVTESSVIQYDGMLRSFQAEEIEAIYLNDGDLNLNTLENQLLQGNFHMESGSYSGEFSATPCTQPEVLQILGFMFEGFFSQ
jgi:hypothetical protein